MSRLNVERWARVSSWRSFSVKSGATKASRRLFSSNGLSAVRTNRFRLGFPGREGRSSMFLFAKAEASAPWRNRRVPACPVSSRGSRYAAGAAEMGAFPSRIHPASSENRVSTRPAPSAEPAVTSGVSIENIRIGIRMSGVSPSVTSTSCRPPREGIVAPVGDQRT